MSTLRRICLLGLTLGGFGQTAYAADMTRGALPQAPLLPQPGIVGETWYLRGDLGYVIHTQPNGEGLLPSGAIRTFENERLGKAMRFGIGAGYRATSWLRADVTLDLSSDAKFQATDSGTAYTQGFSAEKAKFSATTGLVNLYADLGTWSGFTPYLGAGLGFSAKSVSGWKSYVYGMPGFYGCGANVCQSPLFPQPAGTFARSRATDLAWALMAGTAIRVNDRVSLDLGYRYLHLGNITTKLDNTGTVKGRLKDIAEHELRAGVRYGF